MYQRRYRAYARSSSLFSSATGGAGSVLRSSDQLADVVSLALELLPPLPEPSRVLQDGLPVVGPELVAIDGAPPVQSPSKVQALLDGECSWPAASGIALHLVRVSGPS